MDKNIAEMTDSEIIEMLTDYEQRGSSEVLDVSNELEMPTSLLVDLSVALEFLDEVGTVEKGDYPWLAKNLETEMARRAGQIPLI